MVVRHPLLPLWPHMSPVTTASVSYFLGAFLTNLTRLHAQGIKKRPSMLVCDGSIVLLQSLSYNFCRLSLQELLCRYYDRTGRLHQFCIAAWAMWWKTDKTFVENSEYFCKLYNKLSLSNYNLEKTLQCLWTLPPGHACVWSDDTGNNTERFGSVLLGFSPQWH